MSELPESWTRVPLAAITSDVMQRVPSDEETIRYIDIGSVNRTAKRIETPQKLLGRDAPSRARKQVAAGDTLVSMTRPNLNAVALVPKELDGEIASTGFDVLRPAPGVDPRWISYLVRTEEFVNSMSALVQGALYPAVRSKDVRAHVVPLAPAAEQTRIANQLDTLLTRIQSCNDRFGTIPALLKRFRQAVLDVATSGQLTADWRAGGGIERWEYLRADDVCEKVQSGGTPKEGFSEQGVPFLKVYNIVNQKVAFDYKPQYISKENHVGSMSKSQTQPGDVLMNIVGPPLGKVAIVTDAHPTWNINQALTLFRPSNRIATGWLYYVLCGGSNIAEIEHEIRGSAGQVNISLSQCRDFVFPVPPIAEQKEIIRRVEALFALADRVETRATVARTQAHRLGPLVLAKAFRGELVLQDTQDDSAIDLLNRIAATHSSEPKKRIAKVAARGRSKVKAQGVDTRWNGEENLGATMKLELAPDNYLETLIDAADGVGAKELWQKSKLGIDDFYVQLSNEIDRGIIEIDAQDESKIFRVAKG